MTKRELRAVQNAFWRLKGFSRRKSGGNAAGYAPDSNWDTTEKGIAKCKELNQGVRKRDQTLAALACWPVYIIGYGSECCRSWCSPFTHPFTMQQSTGVSSVCIYFFPSQASQACLRLTCLKLQLGSGK